MAQCLSNQFLKQFVDGAETTSSGSLFSSEKLLDGRKTLVKAMIKARPYRT